jgi:hypothetical protein
MSLDFSIPTPGIPRQSGDDTLRVYEDNMLDPADKIVPLPCEPPALVWEDENHLIINGVSFYLSVDTKELQISHSAEEKFLLGKSRAMVDQAAAIGRTRSIRKIFDMGILEGGSTVLYELLFQPQIIAAIDILPTPVKALSDYVFRHNKSDIIKPYYGINQADRSTMEKILSAEFPNRDIDLIVDDASHLYEESREAFNISFPFLREGGLYIIEDWGWAHWGGEYWQKDQNPVLSKKKALSNLLVEFFMMAAGHPELIKEITIDQYFVTLCRGGGSLPAENFHIEKYYQLRGKEFIAWL